MCLIRNITRWKHSLNAWRNKYKVYETVQLKFHIAYFQLLIVIIKIINTKTDILFNLKKVLTTIFNLYC